MVGLDVEIRLANLLIAMGAGEHEIEEHRQKLSQHRDFDPYVLFRQVERKKRQYITMIELQEFLQAHNILMDPDQLEVLSPNEKPFRFMRLIVPVSHISTFDFNLEGLRKLDYSHDVHYQVKKREVKLRIVIDELKQMLVQKAENDFYGLYNSIDTYDDGVLDPDKKTISEEQMLSLFRRIEAKRSGNVTYEEFVYFVCPSIMNPSKILRLYPPKKRHPSQQRAKKPFVKNIAKRLEDERRSKSRHLRKSVKSRGASPSIKSSLKLSVIKPQPVPGNKKKTSTSQTPKTAALKASTSRNKVSKSPKRATFADDHLPEHENEAPASKRERSPISPGRTSKRHRNIEELKRIFSPNRNASNEQRAASRSHSQKGATGQVRLYKMNQSNTQTSRFETGVSEKPQGKEYLTKTWNLVKDRREPPKHSTAREETVTESLFNQTAPLEKVRLVESIIERPTVVYQEIKPEREVREYISRTNQSKLFPSESGYLSLTSPDQDQQPLVEPYRVRVHETSNGRRIVEEEYHSKGTANFENTGGVIEVRQSDLRAIARVFKTIIVFWEKIESIKSEIVADEAFNLYDIFREVDEKHRNGITLVEFTYLFERLGVYLGKKDLLSYLQYLLKRPNLSEHCLFTLVDVSKCLNPLDPSGQVMVSTQRRDLSHPRISPKIKNRFEEVLRLQMKMHEEIKSNLAQINPATVHNLFHYLSDGKIVITWDSLADFLNSQSTHFYQPDLIFIFRELNAAATKSVNETEFTTFFRVYVH